ncbi:hypothetical protein RDABS01_000031 [Bienertia sinuspersici]
MGQMFKEIQTKGSKGVKEIKWPQVKGNKGGTKGLTEIPSSERQQRCQRDQIPSNETEQRDQELTFLQVKGSKGDKESKLLQMKGNKGVKEIKSLKLGHNSPRQAVGSRCRSEGLTYEYTRRSNRSKESLEKAKVKPIHTTGTKSHARVREDMKKSSNKSPTRTQVYLKCHQHESEADITNQIKNVATEQGDQELDLDDDPVSKYWEKINMVVSVVQA